MSTGRPRAGRVAPPASALPGMVQSTQPVQVQVGATPLQLQLDDQTTVERTALLADVDALIDALAARRGGLETQIADLSAQMLEGGGYESLAPQTPADSALVEAIQSQTPLLLSSSILTGTASLAPAADLAALTAGGEQTAGAALSRQLLMRMADFQANLLARRYLSVAECETYVRQNVRTLRAEAGKAAVWRTLVRYLYELQYLRFSDVADHRTFFLRSTWFDADYLETGLIDDATFDALAAAVGEICDSYAVDESQFRAPQ